ncbi:hypothetical protein N7495_004799 [Penicillium taxi]|uniref:uncharacterized protein n=1 Tax=Penicillium taxi TaxID=168475 RepID=UPI002544D96C|nr:uncharacterized protein N7495_004799 [Penicillium taxi]KAJ5900055.1 hypothetical protein N7495_004799 [Penicillium taxi]
MFTGIIGKSYGLRPSSVALIDGAFSGGGSLCGPSRRLHGNKWDYLLRHRLTLGGQTTIWSSFVVIGLLGGFELIFVVFGAPLEQEASAPTKENQPNQKALPMLLPFPVVSVTQLVITTFTGIVIIAAVADALIAAQVSDEICQHNL